MTVTLIAALAANRLIGSASGKIPWDLPRDRAHFRAYTKGKWLLLGRKTYGEMEGWFTDQTPLVLSRSGQGILFDESHRVVPSASAAIHLAERGGADELVVCGGASVFAATLPLADRLVLTRIGTTPAVEDPVFFPEFDNSDEWKIAHLETWPEDPENPFPMRLEIRQRLPLPPARQKRNIRSRG